MPSSFFKVVMILLGTILNLNAAEGLSMDILVIGAGPSGLAVVKALQNQGFSPDIIERGKDLKSDGAGIAIPANGSWALRHLGIDITQKARPIPSMCFTDSQGEVLTQADISEIHPDGDQFHSLSRRELMEILLSSIDASKIQTGISFDSMREEDKKTYVRLSDGTERIYDLVIACDGIHSQVRGDHHSEEVPEFLNLLAWRTMIDDAPADLVKPAYMMGGDRLMLLYPLPGGKAYVYGHLFQEDLLDIEECVDEVFANFGGFVPEVLRKIQEQNPTIYRHHMEKSHSVRFGVEGFSNVLLMGDASHGCGPMPQNGAALGFEDAYALGELLKEPEGIHTLLERFSKRRGVRVQSIFDMSNTRIRVISNPAEAEAMKAHVRENGAPNVNGFKVLMQRNP